MRGRLLPACESLRRAFFCATFGALIAGGCAGASGATQSKHPQAAEEQEAELLALRRENAQLKQRLETQKDQALMCSAKPANEDFGSPAPSLALDERLRPQGSSSARRSAKEPGRTRSVSLQDLPHSAPDPALMARYEQSAAQPESGDKPVRAKRYRMVGSESSVSETSGPSHRSSFSKSPKPKATRKGAGAKELYRRARHAYQTGDRAKARSIFARIESDFPASDLADNAAYWQAEDALEQGHLRQAKEGFMRILSDYPAGNKVEDAMYMLALCYQREQEFASARSLLTQVAKAGRPELRVKARRVLAQIKSAGRQGASAPRNGR